MSNQTITRLYCLRAGLSQITQYVKEIEGGMRRKSPIVFPTALMAKRLLSALNNRYGEWLSPNRWRYLDLLICYLQKDGSDLNVALHMLQSVLLTPEQAEQQECDALQLRNYWGAKPIGVERK